MLRTILLFAGLGAAAFAQETDRYCFGMLLAAPDRAKISEEEAKRIQAGHMAHLNAMAEKGWLRAAGPIGPAGELRGLEISKCTSVEEAIEMGAEDPAVKNKRLTVEVYRWTGPAGLGDRYREEKAKDPAYKIKMVKYPMAMLLTTEAWKGMPAAEMLREHATRARGMLKDGRMKGAGPFEKGGEKIGVFLFAPMEMEEAKRLAEGDPMVKAGLAKVRMYEWYAADGTFRN